MSRRADPGPTGTWARSLPVFAALAAFGLIIAWAGRAPSQTVEAASAEEALARYAPSRIGLLLVSTEERPSPGFRYGGSVMQARKLLTEEREFANSVHRLPDFQEMHLYEALSGAFESRGYQVRCLNRSPWQGLRLKEILEQAEGIDAACVVHYFIVRTHAVLDDGGYSWWAPFEGMHLRLRLAIYDCASADLVYKLEMEALSTDVLYPNLGEMVAEEPLHLSGYDDHGNHSPYKIAIYQTSVRCAGAESTVPMIRTSQGSMDITYEKAPEQVKPKKDPRTGVWVIPDNQKRNTSVLKRLLQYVGYRPGGVEAEYLDGSAIDRCGEAVRGRIPERHP